MPIKGFPAVISANSTSVEQELCLERIFFTLEMLHRVRYDADSALSLPSSRNFCLVLHMTH